MPEAASPSPGTSPSNSPGTRSGAGSHPPRQDDLLLQHLQAFLGTLDAALVDAIRDRVRWQRLAGGQTLMRQGEPGDALYLLISGRLRVYIEDDGERRVVREVARGEVVGEMSLITEAPRSATLVAIRDSVLVRLDRQAYAQLQAQHPQVTLALTRRIIERWRTEHALPALGRPVTMALLPVSGGVDVADFAQTLARELARHGTVGLLDAAGAQRQFGAPDAAPAGDDEEQAQRRWAMHFDAYEGAHDYVLLVADATPSDWTQRCTRHADEILLLADARAAPVLHATETAFLVDRPQLAEAAEVLVLLHGAEAAMPSGTARWLARRPVSDHVHLRRGHAGDMARLARIQSRHAVGLVLAGGGARGFAHLGVYRALREQGIEVDYVGGTSIGAIMAAFIATDQAPQRIEARARAAFARNPTGDFTLVPLVSLIKGRRLHGIVARAVAEQVGAGAGIEDLWKRFFCIATNYTRASEVVLQRGDLVRALMSSVAIPGALPPVLIDGELHCDGGTFNNFPVDVMRGARGIGRVIGVDLSSGKGRRIELDAMPSGWAMLLDRLRPRHSRRYHLPGPVSLLINATILYSRSRQRHARGLTDLYFNPPLERVGMLDWKRYDQVVRQGYEHALEVLGRRAPAPPAA
ncbi:MAG: patatin-like phospholipase family protein [Burkholderiales bacterium]|nr:patatin-like phospholipase family protein [Burkholderiales bacterium]MDE2505371.1 patatin-like phospholipase family protein [Burkholderiales bacterium]